jgi:hypothetical protein
MTQDEEWGIGEVWTVSFSRSPTHLTGEYGNHGQKQGLRRLRLWRTSQQLLALWGQLLTWPQVGRGEAWVLCAFFTGQRAMSELFSSFSLLNWYRPPLWASPENSRCLTKLSGIQWGESASLGKIQRKPLPHINIGSGPIHWFVSGSFHMTRRWVCLEGPQNLSAADCPCLSTF